MRTFLLALAALPNPTYVLVVVVLSMQFGFSESQGGNMTALSPSFALVSLALLLAARGFAFVAVAGRWKGATPEVARAAFLRANAWAWPGWAVVWMWYGADVEGNIAGFIFFPANLLAALVIGLLVGLRQLRELRAMSAQTANPGEAPPA